MMDIKSGMRRRAEEENYRAPKRGRFECTPTREKMPSREELTSNRTEDMELTCPASSALLHTPLVMRTVVPDDKETHTPHSILKGRSAANTPGTPTTVEKLSLSVNRQIRFSFPKDNLAHSAESSGVKEENEQISPPVTPRKSIHQSSSVKDRKGTPANPRILRVPLRNAAVQLQFDDNETTTKEVFPEISATAATLLNISQLVPCETTTSSPYSQNTRSKSKLFKLSPHVLTSLSSSSPSQNTRSKSNLSFKLPHGLDGNTISIDEIENSSRNGNSSLQTDEEVSSNEESYYSLRSSSPSREVPSIESSTSNRFGINPNLSSNIEDDKMSKVEDAPTDNVVAIVTSQDGDVTLTCMQEGEHSAEVNSQSSFSSTNEGVDSLSSSITVAQTSVNVIKTSTPTGNLQSNENNLSESIIYPDDPKSPKEVTISVQGIGSSSFSKKGVKLVDYNVTGESMNESESSLDQDTDVSRIEDIETNKDSSDLQLKKLTFKWTTNASTRGNLQLEVNKGDGHGKEARIAQVSISEEIKLFYSEPHEETVNNTSNICRVIGKQYDPLLENFRKADDTLTKINKHEEKKVDNCVNEAVFVEKEHNLNEMSEKITETNKFPEHSETIVLPVREDDHEDKGITIYGGSTLVEEESNTTELPLNVTGINTEETCPPKDFGTYGNEIKENPVLSCPVVSCKIKENLNKTGFSAELPEQSDQYIHDNIQFYQTYEHVTETESRLPKQLFENSKLVESNQPLQESEKSPEIITETFSVQVLPENEETLLKINESFGTEGYIIEPSSELNEFERTGNCTDFELKVSDEEDNNEAVGDTSVPDKSIKCPVFASLKPLEFAAEDLDKDESQGKDYGEDNNYEEDDDVDIYGDICEDLNEENKLNPSKQQSLDDINYNERSSGDEVVCLSSESEDEMPKKALKTSTPYQRTPVVNKYDAVPEDSLDFEEDVFNDDKSDKDSSSYSSKSEIQNNSNYSGEDDELSSSSSSSSKSLDPSDSNSEVHHGNRSWKDLRKSEILVKEHSCDSEISIESPKYEPIGQNSQVEIGCERNGQSLYHEKENKASINLEHMEFNKITEQNSTCKLSGESVPVKEIDIDPVIKLTEPQPDVLKLALSKRKECVETGSLLDLKSKRSKRYSSADNLTFNKGNKSRRKSCSMHDLASVMIAEQVSARRNSLLNVEQPTFSGTITEKNLPTSCEDYLATEFIPETSSISYDNTPCVSDLPEPERSESDSNKDVRSSIADSGSVLSPQPSFGPDISKSFEQKGTVPEYLKRQSKLLSSRFSCALHDITEEMSAENSSILHHVEGRRSLRKSLSSEQLMECHFEKDSLEIRPSSISAWYDCTKTACESKISECNEEEDKSFSQAEIEQKCLNETSPHMRCVDERTESLNIDINVDDLKEKTMAKGIDRTAHKSNVTGDSFEQNSDLRWFGVGENKIKRTRAHSEPSIFEETDGLTGMSTKRRSSSLLKVESINKMLFSRPFKRRSTRQSLYQSLEIVDSDDSFKESKRTQLRQKDNRTSQDLARKDGEMDFGSKDHSFEAENQSSVNETLVRSELQHSVLSEEDSISLVNISLGPSTSQRLSRATSEPPSYMNRDEFSKPKRSSSLLKINQINKLLFARNDIRKSRSSRSSCFKNLEVVNSSDEEKSIRDLEVATSTSDNFDDMEDIIAPHVVIKNNSKIKEKIDEETLLSKPHIKVIAKEIENTSKKMKGLTNEVADLDQYSTYSRIKQAEVNQPSDFESMIAIHEVQKKLKKSDLMQNKTSKRAKFNLKNVRRNLNVQESTMGDSTSKSPMPPKKQGRMIKTSTSKSPLPPKKQGRMIQPLEVDHDAIEKKERMDIDSSDTATKKVLKKRNNKIEDLTDKTVEQGNIINKSFSGLPRSDEDNVNSDLSQKRKQEDSEAEPSHSKKKKSVKTKEVKRVTNAINSKKAGHKPIHEDKLESQPGDDEKKPVNPPNKKTLKKAKNKLDDKKQPKMTDDKKMLVTKKSTSKDTGEKELEKHQLQQTAGIVIKSVEEITLKKTGKNDDNLQIGLGKVKKDSEAEMREAPIKTQRGRKKEKTVVDLDLSTLDSPARRTRRSVSRMSDTELMASPLTVGANKQSHRTRAMSDIVLSSPDKAGYAESEASEATSITSRLTTPTRRSTRRLSQSTPGTPDMKQDDYLTQRRLTRNQHHQMQKSFELSLSETPRPSRLEDLPEEIAEIENDASPSETSSNLTPVRSSARNANKRTLNYSLTKSRKTTPKK